MMIAKRPVARLIHAVSVPLTLPLIRDITTTPDQPPEFLISRKRGPGMAYPQKNRELQRQAYPDLAPLRLAHPAREIFTLARAVGAGMRDWRLVAEKDGDGRMILQYVATTRFLRFHDDVVIEVKSEGPSCCTVHLRSRSRVGKGDLGSNAQRIRVFLRALKKRASTQSTSRTESLPGDEASRPDDSDKGRRQGR